MEDASNYYDTHSSFNSDGTWTESVDANGVKIHANSFDCSSAFPKSVTKAYGTSIAETFVYSHDCNTGKVVSYKDANSKTTTYTYADSLNRVTAVDYPDGGHTGISYSDGTNSSTTVEVSTGGPQGKMSQTVNYDLIGRTINVQQNAGSDVINVDTYYDAMGHVYSTSNPYAQSLSAPITPWHASQRYQLRSARTMRLHIPCRTLFPTNLELCQMMTSSSASAKRFARLRIGKKMSQEALGFA